MHKISVSHVLLGVLVVVSVSLNVVLARKVRQYQEYRDASERLPEGTRMPVLRVVDRSGDFQRLGYSNSGAGTVLYFFSRSCGACARNVANLKSLANQIGNRYRLAPVLVGEQDLPGYVTKYRLEFPVYSDMNGAAVWAFKVYATPQTTIVDGKGRVVRNWVGPYGPVIQKEIEDYLGVKLPGMTSPGILDADTR